MRRAERCITDAGEIEAILRSTTVCRLGLCDGDTPYVVPVCFGYAEGSLYIHSAAEGRKIDLIGRNPKVCFEVDTDVCAVRGEQPCAWSFRYRSVTATGTASIVTDTDEKTRALGIIMSGFTDGPYTFAVDKVAKTVVIRIDIKKMTGKKAGY